MLPAMTDTLAQLGLPRRMTDIYLFVIERGEIAARDVAKTFNLTRSTAHDALCSLVRFGLVKSFRRGRERWFALESSETLGYMLDQERLRTEQRARALAQVTPSLYAIHARGNRQTGVRYFSKQEDIDAARREFQGEHTMEFADDRMHCDDRVAHRTIVVTNRSGIATEGIRTISPSIVEMYGQTFIAEDRVLFIPSGETPVAVEIRCRSIAGMCRFAFELSWKAAGEWGNV